MAKRRPVHISASEAVSRLDKMVPILYRNIESAIHIEATMVVGNDIVGNMPQRSFPGALSFNRIMRSLAYDLAMHLSRLFDVGTLGKPINKRDVASIPLAARLLRQQRCKRVLSQRARNWSSHDNSYQDLFERDCLSAIDRAVAAYSAVNRGRFGRGGRTVLREFRNNFMAHSLMTESDANPIYNQLYRLTDDARDFVQDARLAVLGIGDDLKAHERLLTKQAERFWRMALLGERDDDDALPAWASENRRSEK